MMLLVLMALMVVLALLLWLRTLCSLRNTGTVGFAAATSRFKRRTLFAPSPQLRAPTNVMTIRRTDHSTTMTFTYSSAER